MATSDPINPHKMAWAHKSDLEVASKVRMLTRGDLDHEAVCIAGRDRIMYLSQRVERLERALAEIESCPFDIEGFPPADEAAAWMNGRATQALALPKFK